MRFAHRNHRSPSDDLVRYPVTAVYLLKNMPSTSCHESLCVKVLADGTPRYIVLKPDQSWGFLCTPGQTWQQLTHSPHLAYEGVLKNLNYASLFQNGESETDPTSQSSSTYFTVSGRHTIVDSTSLRPVFQTRFRRLTRVTLLNDNKDSHWHNNVIKSMSYPRGLPRLLHVAVLAEAIRVQDLSYTLLKHHCYWYANLMYFVLEKRAW